MISNIVLCPTCGALPCDQVNEPNVDALERLLTLIETADEHGDECAIVEQASKVRAAFVEKHRGGSSNG